MLSRTARQPLQKQLLKSSIWRDRGLLGPRQFSQLSSSRVRLGQGSVSINRSSLLSWQSIGLKSGSISSVRYASTEAASPEPPAPVVPPSSTPSAAEADLAPTSSFTDPIAETTKSSPGFFERMMNPMPVPEMTSDAVQQAPDTIGYLSSLGLDNGWGPTSVMQFFLEHVHVYTGAPWWASVVVTAVAMRIVFLPIFIRMADNTARTRELQPLLHPIIHRQRQALLDKDIMLQQQLRAEMFDAYKKTGVNPWLAFGSLIQIPFQVGAFIITRQMAYLPVPGLETAGTAWFMDLTSADPFFLLPAASSAFLYLSMKLGQADMPSSPGDLALKYIRVGLPLLSLGITCTMPSILTLHFATSSFLAFVQAMFLRNASVRRYLNIYPLKGSDEVSTLQQQQLSPSAQARLNADQEIIKKEKEKAAQASKGGVLSSIMNTQAGIGTGIKDQMRKSREEQEHKNYEKRAKEEDKARKRRGKRI